MALRKKAFRLDIFTLEIAEGSCDVPEGSGLHLGSEIPLRLIAGKWKLMHNMNLFPHGFRERCREVFQNGFGDAEVFSTKNRLY